METIIKMHPSELNVDLIKKIREYIGNNQNIYITISLAEFDPSYVKSLHQSIEEANNTESQISFTMEEFIAYVPEGKQ